MGILTVLKAFIMSFWLLIMSCQKQAMSGSREIAKSDCNLISPSAARGERTDEFGGVLASPKGRSVPLSSTSR